ncbi:XdhC family protein [Wenyingzhuangia sp. IMCC45574]
MTHEFKDILQAYTRATSQGKKTVLATLVAVNGSSYRKEGVRMLVIEDEKYVGAVSGGCVEKEIVLQSQLVFKTGVSKIITYDGRYRLGCEGVLYILLEELKVTASIVKMIQNCFEQRIPFDLNTHYSIELDRFQGETYVNFRNDEFPLSNSSPSAREECFHQRMKPIFQLYIIGAEHDAAALSQQANFLGWKVTVVASGKDFKSKHDFKGAHHVIHTTAGNIQELKIDNETAIVLMNHNYAKDLLFLRELKQSRPKYIGLLGAVKRREKLMNDLLEDDLDISEAFLDCIYGPTGLDIGSVTPQEIAVSIVSEIIAINKNKEVQHLQPKTLKAIE